MSYSIAGAGARPLSRVDARSTIYVASLSLAAAYFLVWPIWRAQFVIEIWFTESWNAYWQDAAAAWLPIYPAPEGLVGNNYPPLSFYAVGVLGKLLGVDNLFVGRWLSLAAVGAIAIEIFAAVRILTGGRIGAAVAALWYLAIMARNSTVYVGANDPQLAGLAIMGAGLVWFLRRTELKATPTPALLLMVLAGFWKHNNVAIPLATLAWLYVDRSQYAHQAMRVSVEAVLVALAACVVAFGPNFIPDLLASRHYGLDNVLGQVGHLQWSALALAIWAAWAVYDRSAPAKFTALHIGLALLTCLAQWFGHGVFGNAEFDLILALAIGLGVAFERLKSDRYRDAIIVALLLRLFLSDRQETALLLFSPEFRESVYASERNLVTQAKAVAAVPGDAACFIKLVCRQAGKPFVVDDFKTDELLATGKATPADIAALLDARGIRWIPKSLPTGPEASISLSRWWRS